MQHELGFVSARSAYFYDGAARSLVTGLKYEGQRVLAPLMAALAAPDLAETVAGVPGAVLTWVPTHGATQRRRGYNHAEIFARALSPVVDTPWIAPPARKVRRTRHQQGLDREARMRNLKGAFVPVPTVLGQEVGGIVLVDDVYTTGATAGEAAAAIARATGVPVHVFTFCRTEADVQRGLR
ncbi:MAG: hypothetical protein M1325_05300 [Actinobacteria bacterium]|nr:hypothetical protein [Actinomycetota bacterium]